jgi:2-polyprenyl-3-methyl-5-hydroxy-6-metoxy-1,4-benzoquinol methylase
MFFYLKSEISLIQNKYLKLIQTLVISAHYFLQLLVRPIEKYKKIIRNFVLKNADNKIKILDFGCGEGVFSDTFSGRRQIGYIELDREYSRVRFAKKIHSSNLYIAGNENLCFKGNSFDFILLNNVLHHMSFEEVSVFLLEAKRLLKNDACLIIIELVPPSKQKGIFLRLVVYLEEKIKKINYFNEKIIMLVEKEFKKSHEEMIGSNFMLYIFK